MYIYVCNFNLSLFIFIFFHVYCYYIVYLYFSKELETLAKRNFILYNYMYFVFDNKVYLSI